MHKISLPPIPKVMIPDVFHEWFANKNWHIRDYQARMVDAFVHKESTLLIAPTGGGKTLSGFLPTLIDLYQNPQQGLHTLYISPLKALTNDIERNVMQPIKDMGLNITVETRTGDTPSHKRIRQRNKPPHILLTTPESLMLMLSYPDAAEIFNTLKLVIVDEIHNFAHNKRGDFTALTLARLQSLAPDYIRFGLSATVARPPELAAWLGPANKPAHLMITEQVARPEVEILRTEKQMPYAGYIARYAVEDIYKKISEAKTTLVFVNTRAQAELMFQMLWDSNVEAFPIAVYHGSLTKEQRRKTEAMMASGKLRAIVATSALELGIDWGDVDLVIQIGAPKGVSRLLQRIGRSNHRLDTPSKALLVPANRFEVLECQAAMNAIAKSRLDGEPLHAGSLDILPQYIMNSACSGPIAVDDIYQEILNAEPYKHVDRKTFHSLFQFSIDGGYALRSYEQYQRLELLEDGRYQATSRAVIMRHRQNIGTIVEAGKLKVKRLWKTHQGKILGEVEENFAQQLTKGDTFLFAGEVLAFEGVEDMILEAWPAKGKEPKLPSYNGGQMPLSTFLADGVRNMLSNPDDWHQLPPQICEWLDLQEQYSALPDNHSLLVEQFPYQKLQYAMFYTFEGRPANQTLGMLLTRRMERMVLKPISFSVTDYGLSISSINPITEDNIQLLFSQDILGADLEEWIMESPMLKRSFREVATITGLTEQKNAGNRKTLKQVTFSTDLIYDVLRKYEQHHILLQITRQDAERGLLDIERLADLLKSFEGRIKFKSLPKVSPMAIPIILDVKKEQLRGSGVDELLQQESMQDRAEHMMDEIREVLDHD